MYRLNLSIIKRGNKMQTIKVKKIGNDSGYCREYFKTEAGKIVVKQEAREKGKFDWFSCEEIFGEPEYPINGINFIEA